MFGLGYPTFRFVNQPEDVAFSCRLKRERCVGITKKGIRCKRNTIKQLDVCHTHLKSMYGLKIQPSSIPQAGLGLFTTRPFKKNEQVGRYIGEKLNEDQVDDRYGESATAPYTLQVAANTFVDSACQRGFTSYINHTTKSKANCRFVVNPKKKSARVVTTKAIPAGKELFLNYGSDYQLKEPGITSKTTY